MSRTALILPVRNAGRHLDRLLPALAAQSLRPDEWLALDSESSDGSRARLLAAGASVVPVRAADFNHGGTRRLASELTDAKVLIYLTQDAIPAGPDALRRLRDALLAEDDIGVAYGRQLPRPGRRPVGRARAPFQLPAVQPHQAAGRPTPPNWASRPVSARTPSPPIAVRPCARWGAFPPT
ncbi:hypothetical protein JOS77_13905 [Chromobacterium haemolyticum]|nr:hypothetical protein JOS77_13905 [Chromobacterium haemolyticum]